MNLNAELHSTLAAFVRRFVVLSEAQATTLALWIVHTHALSAAESTPYLALSSGMKRSGKTRTLEVPGAPRSRAAPDRQHLRRGVVQGDRREDADPVDGRGRRDLWPEGAGP